MTGTDTGAGKTVVAAAITAALRARGVDARALKPVLSGLEETAGEDWPHDHEALAIASGTTPDRVVLRSYGPPVSPHLAVELSGVPLEPARLPGEITAAGAGCEMLIVEGVGGLLVPLSEGWDVRGLAAALGLPVVIAARAGLGTINHCLLTLEAARSAGLRPVGVVFSPWPEDPGAIERSNFATVAELGDIEVAGLPFVARADAGSLALAGARLPLDRWLGPGSTAGGGPRPPLPDALPDALD